MSNKEEKKSGGNVETKKDENLKVTNEDGKEVKEVVKEKKPKKEDKKKEEKVKNPYEKMTEKEILKKIEDQNNLITTELQERETKFSNLNIQIVNKEKEIFEMGSANKKYMGQLEGLKKQIDKQLGNFGLREIHTQMKNLSKKEQPKETQLAQKEKELDNVNKLIEILRKEKKNIDQQSEKNNFNKVNELHEKLIKLEKTNVQLETQIKNTNRSLEESNKLREISDKQQQSKGIFQNEIRDLKNKLTEVDEKFKEKKHSIHIADIESKKMKSEVDLLHKRLPEVKPRTYNNLKSLSPKKSEKETMSKSLDQVNRFKFLTKNPRDVLAAKFELFSEEERIILKEKIPETKLVDFEKRFNDALNKKEVQSKKQLEEIRTTSKKQYELEERLEFNLKQLKEKDQKTKIQHFQINEYNSENRLLNKKLNEIKSTTERLKKIYTEKVFEHNLLLNEIERLKTIHSEQLEKAKQLKIQQQKSQELRENEDENEEENKDENDDDDN